MNKRVFNALRKIASGINSEVGGVPKSQLEKTTFRTPGRYPDEHGTNQSIDAANVRALREQYGDDYVRYLPIYDPTNPEGAKRAFQELKIKNNPAFVIDNIRNGYSIKPEYPGAYYYGPAKIKNFNNQ